MQDNITPFAYLRRIILHLMNIIIISEVMFNNILEMIDPLTATETKKQNQIV
jgi:hypothetical protein